MKKIKKQSKLRNKPKKNNKSRALKPRVKELEHTADVGLQVYARDEKELFCNTAEAMFGLIAE